jgi:hypothetical protein
MHARIALNIDRNSSLHEHHHDTALKTTEVSRRGKSDTVLDVGVTITIGVAIGISVTVAVAVHIAVTVAITLAT